MRVSLMLMSPPVVGAMPRCTVVADKSNWLAFAADPRSGEPPAGFAAVCALLAAPAEQLGRTRPVPSYVPLPAGAPTVPVVSRLGAGGYSDAYDVELPDGIRAVLKLPHHDAVTRRADLTAERLALAALPAVPELPRLVTGPHYDARGGAAPQSLVFLPVGAPLERAQHSFIEAASSAAAQGRRTVPPVAIDDVRRAFAAGVYTALLAALRAAHGAGVTHGDVRPANVVAHGGTYVLVDWGHATAHGPPALLRREARDQYDDDRVADLRGACLVYHVLTGLRESTQGSQSKAAARVTHSSDAGGRPVLGHYNGRTDALSAYYHAALDGRPLLDSVAYAPPLQLEAVRRGRARSKNGPRT
jgi:hypothetical protein